jgi:hypothetical protein
MRLLRRLSYRAALALLSLVCAAFLAGCGPVKPVIKTITEFGPQFCGALGGVCCHAPVATDPSLGPIVACNKGLGCDVLSNRCVQPCGGTGQACCDGPETRATKWTAAGALYSPNTFNMVEMCNAGACDAQSHRCFSCGTKGGQACCPPDAAQATARCIGDHVECQFSNDAATSGVCLDCGSKGKPPCLWGCDSNLDLRHGLCDICGGELQPPCDRGCNLGLRPAQGLCRRCGGNGQIPCDTGCDVPFKPKSGLCAACGGDGQASCDGGCDAGLLLINNVCHRCGGNGQPPCNQSCNYPMKPVNGVCRLCGANGQIPCESGCNSGLVQRNGVCAVPQPPPPVTCSSVDQACVPDTQPGTHCCQSGTPELCVYQMCRACVPHGQQCLPGGTQICCSAKDGDVCKFDQATEMTICDIPG